MAVMSEEPRPGVDTGLVDAERIITPFNPDDPAGAAGTRAAQGGPRGLSGPPATLSEAAWVARAQDGDVVAFEWLVNAYQGELFRLAYRMLSDRGAAEDAVQDTFLIVWRRLPGLADPQAFRAWIYRIGTRRCLNTLRARNRHLEIPQGADFERQTQPHDVVDRGDDPAAMAQAQATRRGLDDVLTTISPEQRACWVLRELHDLSYPEIAYAIGVPLSTVRGRIARARQNLANGMSSWR